MKINNISLILVTVLPLFATALPAQPWRGWRGSGGWGMQGPYQRIYDPSKVETLSGVVESVDLITPMQGMIHKGVHLMLKTDRESISVHLGPDWYIEKLDIKIEKGDTVEVKGSRVVFQGKPAIIAAEVRKGESVLILRDASGIPVWAGGWRR